MVIVCRRHRGAAKRLERVLWNDPATGVMRHADAGYAIALDCAREKGLDLPGILPGDPLEEWRRDWRAPSSTSMRWRDAGDTASPCNGFRPEHDSSAARRPSSSRSNRNQPERTWSTGSIASASTPRPHWGGQPCSSDFRPADAIRDYPPISSERSSMTHADHAIVIILNGSLTMSGVRAPPEGRGPWTWHQRRWHQSKQC
jgi:hypothetical protein